MAKPRTCWTPREAFVEAIGTVNAEIVWLRTGVKYSTKYRLVAERIASLAKACGTTVLETVTDDGTYVVSAKGFYKP